MIFHCVVRRHDRIMAAKVTDDRDAGITWLANSCPRVIDVPFMIEAPDFKEIMSAETYRAFTDTDERMVWSEVTERQKELNSR